MRYSITYKTLDPCQGVMSESQMIDSFLLTLGSFYISLPLLTLNYESKRINICCKNNFYEV